MLEEGYAILVTPENYDYLEQVCAQLGELDYLYPEYKALNIFRVDTGDLGVYIIHALPSSVFNRCTLITEEHLIQLMFIYFLEK